MAKDIEFGERRVRRKIGGSITTPVLGALGALALLLLFFWLRIDGALSTDIKGEERELVAVTFIVGGMMKARSGAT